MNLNKEEDRIAWKPFLDVILSLCVLGNNDDFYVLNPKYIYTSRKVCREVLEAINVTDDVKLSEILDFFVADQVDKEFQDMQNTLALMSLVERSAYIQLKKHKPEYQYKLSIVNKYIGRLTSSGISGYYYGWAMFYCYAGTEMDFMKEEKKWEYIGLILQKILNSYSNWKEYIHAFQVGVFFNSSILSDDISRQTQKTLIKLLVSPSSPVHKSTVWK